jgi:hypothetical protein
LAQFISEIACYCNNVCVAVPPRANHLLNSEKLLMSTSRPVASGEPPTESRHNCSIHMHISLKEKEL